MEYVKLKELTKIVTGGTPRTNVKEYWENGNIPWLQSGVCKDGLVKQCSKYITSLGLEKSSAKMMPKNTVIIALTGATTGKVGLLEIDACANQSVTGILPNEKFASKYIFYYLQSIRHDILFDSYGEAQNHISQDYVKNILVPLPSVQDQLKIIDKIEELFSELDKAEETLLKIKSQLEIYKQAVLKEAFLECDNDIKLSCLCECITDGDHMPPPKADNGIPFVMISNIKNNVIQWENTAFVGNDYYNNLDEKRKPRKNDVLYTVTGSFGIPVLVDFEKNFCFQRHIALLRPNEQILPHFLYYSLQHPTVYLQASKRATGTAQKTVGLGVLRNIEIPFVNSLQTQRHIVNKIEAEEYKHNCIKKVIIDTLMKIKALRQSILKEAFEGKLV